MLCESSEETTRLEKNYFHRGKEWFPGGRHTYVTEKKTNPDSSLLKTSGSYNQGKEGNSTPTYFDLNLCHVGRLPELFRKCPELPLNASFAAGPMYIQNVFPTIIVHVA